MVEILFDGSDRKTFYEQQCERHPDWRTSTPPTVSGAEVRLTPHQHDYWQDKQMAWQEQVDDKMLQYDASVAAHWPVHLAVGCTGCPKTQTMPIKPSPPFDRALLQNAREVPKK